MLFTFLVVAVVPQALSLRPSASASARSSKIAQLRALATGAPGSSDPVSALQEVASVVNSIMLQEGNATEHLTAADKEVLEDVIEMLNDKMYVSMDDAMGDDNATLVAAIDRIKACWADFEAETADGGDIKILYDLAWAYQIELNDLQDDVNVKTTANTTAWNNLVNHISMIGEPEECKALPNPRNMPSLDVYFSSSAYVTWYTLQSEAYWPVREAFREADRQLQVALTLYAVGLAKRNVAYCDWKKELEAGCARYSACYEREKAHYLNVDKPGVEKRIQMRIEAYKAGETIIHQIRFLLALETDQATPPISADRYQMSFPDVPAKRECDMSALDDDSWVPTPVCQGQCLPPVENEADAGYQDAVYGWYDVQGCGQCNDYCRWVGNGGPGPDPATGHLWHGQSWWSCRLAGTDNVYTKREHFTNKFADGWPYKKCSGKGAEAVPTKQLLDGCSTGGNLFNAWGVPRLEAADQRAGEAVCCDDAGTCTRRISSGSGEFGGFSHQNCITPDGGKVQDGVDLPSWTWSEAKAHCEAAGLRLPTNQQEMDTSCNTGCHTNFALAWTA